jgi:predicted CXXCH cytochrome family protein
MQYRHLHWSDFDGVGQCQECHASEGDEHEFTSEDSSSLCVSCHEELTDEIEAAETVHEPMEDGCLDCHDPHGGEVEALLAGVVDDDVRSLCFECHEEEILEQEFAHGPADQGACHMCHDPHASNISPLLLGQGLDARASTCAANVTRRSPKRSRRRNTSTNPRRRTASIVTARMGVPTP